MYKIEWKTASGNMVNSLHIDRKEYPAKCQKFAMRCNDLETQLRMLYDRVPDHLQESLEDYYFYERFFKKWMTGEEADLVLGGSNLNYAIENGELGYSMEGGNKLFDRWEVFEFKKLIISQ